MPATRLLDTLEELGQDSVDKCAICKQHPKGEKLLRLTCGHIFSSGCLLVWFSEIFSRHNTCPFPRCTTKLPIPRQLGSGDRQLLSDIERLATLTNYIGEEAANSIEKHWQKLGPGVEALVKTIEVSKGKRRSDLVTGPRSKILLPFPTTARPKTELEAKAMTSAWQGLSDMDKDDRTLSVEASIFRQATIEGRLEELFEHLETAKFIGQTKREQEARVRQLDKELCDCNLDAVLNGARLQPLPCLDPEHQWPDFNERIEAILAGIEKEEDYLDEDMNDGAKHDIDADDEAEYDADDDEEDVIVEYRDEDELTADQTEVDEAAEDYPELDPEDFKLTIAIKKAIQVSLAAERL